MVELDGVGSIINGATQSSFNSIAFFVNPQKNNKIKDDNTYFFLKSSNTQLSETQKSISYAILWVYRIMYYYYKV